MFNLSVHLHKHSLKNEFTFRQETASQIKQYIANNGLIELNAISIDNNIPLASIYYDQYTESEKSLSQFIFDSSCLMTIKQIDESIYNKIIAYLSIFSKYIYAPFPLNNNPIHVLINDNPNIYMLYIFEIYKVFKNMIHTTNPQQLCSHNHYQIDIRFIPYILHYIDPKEKVLNWYEMNQMDEPRIEYVSDTKVTVKYVLDNQIDEITKTAENIAAAEQKCFEQLLTVIFPSIPIDVRACDVEYEEENNFEISNRKIRDEGFNENGIKNGINVIRTLQFIRDLKKNKEYRRIEMIIDRNGKGTKDDNIYKYVAINGNKIPHIALENASICKIMNSKGVIIPNKLRAEDEGVVTVSFHITPQCIKLYLLYGVGDGLIGSRVFPENLREKLGQLFYDNGLSTYHQNGFIPKSDERILVNLDGMEYGINYNEFKLGIDELHENTRKYFGNDDKRNNKTDGKRVRFCIDNNDDINNQRNKPETQLITFTNDRQIAMEQDDIFSSLDSCSIHSAQTSPSPIHPVVQQLTDKLAAKGALTAKNLEMAEKMIQQKRSDIDGLLNESDDEMDCADPLKSYHLLPDHFGNNDDDDENDDSNYSFSLQSGSPMSLQTSLEDENM